MNMKPISASTYRSFTINTGVHTKLSCNKATLDQVIDLVEYMPQKHSKTLCVRLDIMNAADGYTILERHHITRVLEETRRHLESKLKNSSNKLDLHYVWATEQTSKTEYPHYHCFILVNGNAIQNGYSVREALNRIVMKWQQTHKQGLVHFSESNGKSGIMLNRNASDFERRKGDAVYAGSYLAKMRSKEHRPKGARFSSASRFPRRTD
jgi:hypothetical protein